MGRGRKMPRSPNLVGEVFGRLTVVERAGMRGTRTLWACFCECGNPHAATTSDLRYGGVQSCGCLLAGRTAKNYRHGHSTRSLGFTRTYNSWRAMIDRCTNPNNIGWENYGGRGITICDRWVNSFESFLSDMGDRPKGLTLDRIDNDGNYNPINCRWATWQEQRSNTRRPAKNKKEGAS